VECYTEAVERYAEQELYGGAIALCDKILRLAPQQIDVYRTLGRLHAATGLTAEARSNFLEYASRLEEKGDAEGPIDAFRELARLTSDGHLHLEVIDRLLERGRRDEAIEELRFLHEGAPRDSVVAVAVRERLESLAPELLADDADAEPDEPGTPSGPEEVLEEAERIGDVRAAFQAAGQLLDEDPDRVSVHRKRVELASALDDQPLLVRAYLDLAHCLERTGSAEAALSVFTRVLELEPDNPDARRAIRAGGEKEEAGGPEPTEPTSSAEEAASGESAETEAAAPEPAEESATTGSSPAGTSGASDFDDMLVGFRAGSAETVGEADPEAHCELGVALFQMGKLEDAIREFQAAARSPEPPVLAFELLGQCFLEQDLHRVAVRVLTRALRLPGHAEVELLGVLYRLGLAHEALGASEQALECFERVYSIDIDFRDVGERMRACAL
jgi:tetratricopeptide (TPR) repeat protein